MGGIHSTKQEWRGTNEEMADLMMPLYYIKDAVLNTGELTLAESTWKTVVDGEALGYLDYRTKHGDSNLDIPKTWFTKKFYGRLFDVNPSAQSLFTNSIAQQTKVLEAIVSTALSCLKDPIHYQRTLEALAHVHVKQGVKGVQFAIAGDVLLWTLNVALLTGFTDELRTIWTKLYSRMLKFIVPTAIGDERALFKAEKKQRQKVVANRQATIPVDTSVTEIRK